MAVEVSDRIVVMYAGQVVETGSVRDVLQRPRHPYTRALLAAVPRVGAERGEDGQDHATDAAAVAG